MNIVIDLDGTLINSAPDVQHVASTILSGLRKDDLTLDEARAGRLSDQITDWPLTG